MKIYCSECGHVFTKKNRENFLRKNPNIKINEIKVLSKHCQMCNLDFNVEDVYSSTNIISLLKSELDLKNEEEFYIVGNNKEKFKIVNHTIWKKDIKNSNMILSDDYWAFPDSRKIEGMLSGESVFEVSGKKKSTINFIDFFKGLYNIDDGELFSLVFHSGKRNKYLQRNPDLLTFKILRNKVLLKKRDSKNSDIFYWERPNQKWLQAIFSGLTKVKDNKNGFKIGFNIIKTDKILLL